MIILLFFLTIVCILCLIYIGIILVQRDSYIFSGGGGEGDIQTIAQKNDILEKDIDQLIDQVEDQEGILSIKIQKLLEENKQLRSMLAHGNLSNRDQIIDKININEKQLKEYIKKDINAKKRINKKILYFL